MISLAVAVVAGCADPAAFLADHEIVAHVPPSIRAELCAGLLALPPLLRTAPGGPLRIEIRTTAAPLGLGDGSSERPEWNDGAFVLYAYDDAGDHRAMLRLRDLDRRERERLWRRRAVVHAVMKRWDESLGWSERAEWRRATGWLSAFDRPLTFSERSLNTFNGAFSRARGATSAALDLVTFAEEAFVPAESIRAEALTVDERVACQEFSRLRALHSLLLRSDLLDSSGVPALEPTRCPAFERWLDADALTQAEVLFVASSGRRPESMFGHMLLRLVHEGGTRVRGPAFGIAVQLVALNGAESSGIRYALRGLAGGYPLVTLTSPLGDVLRESLRFEQRTIRRYRLNLTRVELRRLAERVWESERRGYTDYWFFSENCAAALVSLVDGALDGGQVERPPGPWVLPTAVLDSLAQADRPRPLLEPIAAPFESSLDEAARALASRDAIAAELDLPADWRNAHGSSDPAIRAKAYERLPELAGKDSRRAYAYVATTLRFERAAADLAEAEYVALVADMLAEKALAAPLDARDLAKERQSLFEREDELARRLAVLGRETPLLDALRQPPRALTADEQLVANRAEAAGKRLRRIAELGGELVAQLDVDALEWNAEDAERHSRAEERGRAGTLTRSGAGRLSIAPGLIWGGSEGIRPLATLRSAAYAEEPGDRRAHGIAAASGLRVLDEELSWSLGAEPRLERSRLTILGFRSLARTPAPLRSSSFDALGWNAAARWDYDAHLPLPQRARLFMDALAIVDASRTFDRFVTLGFGLESRTMWGADAWSIAAAPRATLSARLPLGTASAVHLDAAALRVFDLFTGESEWDLLAEARVELLVGPLLVAPLAALRSESGFVVATGALALEWP